MRCYVCGPMDRVPDGGVEWRQRITPILNDMGVIVMNPCLKPYLGSIESPEERELRHYLKAQGDLEAVARHMRPIRRMDLKMVDVSDFLVVSVNIEIHMCGSYEEITLANRQKKPILCWVQQGRNQTPDWLLGMLPAEYFFSTIEDVVTYLKIVDVRRHAPKRWYTPRFEILYDEKVLGIENKKEMDS